MPMNSRLMRPRQGGYTAKDADARSYITRVELQDGQKLEPAVARAIDDFVAGCKTDGIWSAIKASCILIGARTLSGALTALVGSNPTNVNFVSGDYDRKNGLLGNGSTKRINSGRSNNADGQNDRHIAVWATTRQTNNSVYVACQTSVNVSGDSYIYQSADGSSNTAKLSSSSLATLTGTNFSSGLYAISRDPNNVGSIIARRAGANVTISNSSVTPINESLIIYGTTSLYSNSRLAFYSIGAYLDLALFDSRLGSLVTAIGAAIK